MSSIRATADYKSALDRAACVGLSLLEDLFQQFVHAGDHLPGIVKKSGGFLEFVTIDDVIK